MMHTCTLFFVLLLPASSHLVTFDNKKPRTNSLDGSIINAHDGTIRRYSPAPAPFFYHAVGYPPCNETGAIDGCTSCIYGVANSLTVWSSPDLSQNSWDLVETIYPSPTSGFPACTYFRSQAVYNPATQLYVLWVNVPFCTPKLPSMLAYATATAPTPSGPFTFHGFTEPAASTLGNKSGFIGDFALLADADGKGWVVLTHGIAGAGHRDMYVFQLSEDFLSFGAASVGPLPGPNLVEAPVFFRRGDTYHVLLGGCSCMGLYGGGVASLTAPSPLGPWVNASSTIDPGCPMEKQSTCFEMGPGAVCNPVTQAQQNFVITVPLVGGGETYLWTGDKWQQSPNGKYDEQPQTWLPLEFDGDAVLPLRYVDQFTLDVL